MNDAARNDREETIPPEVIEQMKELGGFGIQVPLEYEGVGLNNSQYARIGDITGGYDLGVAIAIGAHQVGGVIVVVLIKCDSASKVRV